MIKITAKTVRSFLIAAKKVLTFLEVVLLGFFVDPYDITLICEYISQLLNDY